MAGVALAAQGTSVAVVASLGPLADLQERSAPDQCRLLTDKGVSITESLERSAPANEGKATTFEHAFWRPEFAREGYPQVERSRTPIEGMLTISDRSLTFVPPPGATSVRIPYELVRDVEVRGDAVTGNPGSLIVRSCHGRFDIVTFRQGGTADSAMTAEAAVELKTRVAALRTADN